MFKIFISTCLWQWKFGSRQDYLNVQLYSHQSGNYKDYMQKCLRYIKWKRKMQNFKIHIDYNNMFNIVGQRPQWDYIKIKIIAWKVEVLWMILFLCYTNSKSLNQDEEHMHLFYFPSQISWNNRKCYEKLNVSPCW
jgi:hypothetical protein